MCLTLEQRHSSLELRFAGDDLALVGPLPPCLSHLNHQTSEDNRLTRFFPRDYTTILQLLQTNNVPYTSKLPTNWRLPPSICPNPTYELKEFQEEAVREWLSQGSQGIIVLPTGSGKTIVGTEAIRRMNVRTLVVVPTLVLLEQWRNRVESLLSLPTGVGSFGGGKQEVEPITIITYDSAALYSQRLRSRFGLLILDEAHHLVGSSYEVVADGYTAPHRLALTATLSEEERAHENLTTKGFRSIVYVKTPQDLQTEEVLSDFQIKTIKVRIADLDEYKRLVAVLQEYIRKNKLYGPKTFQQIVYRVNRDPEAQQALDAYRRARELSFSADAKLVEVERLLRRHRGDKVIIFSDIVAFCERIARVFLIPSITHRTPSEERNFVLDQYKRRPDGVIVVSKVLDEGVDVPDAKVGIIVAGSGQSRQFIQRLGRILRRHPEKDQALLYEVISEDTLEERVARRRKKEINQTS